MGRAPYLCLGPLVGRRQYKHAAIYWHESCGVCSHQGFLLGYQSRAVLNEIKAISKMLQCLWLGLRFLHSFEKDGRKKKNLSAKGPQCYFSLDRGEAEIFTACCLEIQAVRRGKNLLAVSLRGSKPWLGPERAAPRALYGLLRCDGELGGGL